MVSHTIILSAIISLGLGLLAAGERLGGIDMQRACRDQYGPTGIATEGFGTSCNAWLCHVLDGHANPPAYSIDTPQACVSQYGSGAYAVCNGGVYDWACYR
jgi:hypothetical protein